MRFYLGWIEVFNSLLTKEVLGGGKDCLTVRLFELLDGLDRLERLDGLDRLDRLEIMDRLDRMDRSDRLAVHSSLTSRTSVYARQKRWSIVLRQA